MAGLAALAVALVLRGTGQPRPAAGQTRRPTPSPSATPGWPARVVTTTRLPVTGLSALTLSPAAVWVLDSPYRSLTGTLVRVDRRTAAITGRLIVQGQGQGPGGVAYGAGSVWLLAGQRVDRIDPRRLRVTATIAIPVDVGQVSQLAYGDGFAWLAVNSVSPTGGARLARIDPRTDRITGVVAVPGAGPASFVAPGAAGIWLANADYQGLTLLDPRSLHVLRNLALAVDPGPFGGPWIAQAGRAVWVLVGYGLVRIDPVTDVVADPLYPPTQAVARPSRSAGPALNPMAVDVRERLWVASGKLSVTGAAGGALHPVAHTAGALDVAAAGDRVWVLTADALVQLDVSGPAFARLSAPAR